MDFEALKEFVKYTMTLAAAGFAFHQTALELDETFFGLETVAGLSARRLLGAAVIEGLALYAGAILFGVFYLSGMAGMASLRDRLKNLADRREVENARRASRGLDPQSESDDELRARRALEDYAESAKTNARTHFWLLAAGFGLSTLLFVEQIADPREAPGDCVLSLTPEGRVSVPASCV